MKLRWLTVIVVVSMGMMLFVPSWAQAQEITQNRALNFGSFAVSGNDAPSTLQITPENTVIAGSGIIVGQNGERGEYTLTGLPPNVSFFLGVEVPNSPSEGGVILEDPTPASVGAGPSFTLEGLTISNGGVMQSDAMGDAILYIGGTLRSSGNGQRYQGGVYVGTYTLRINY